VDRAVSFPLTRRRVSGLAIAGLLTAVYLYGAALAPAALDHSREATGWVLLGLCLFLLLFNIRKRLAAFPLARGHVWLQAHVYLGLFSGIAFFVHSDWRLPVGLMDWCLWLVFAGVFVTGVFGIVLSRTVPSRLNARGERVIFERIPTFRAQIASEVEGLVLRAVKDAASSTIADLYATRLLPFLSGSRNFWAHAFSATAHRQALQNEINAVRRYLPPEGNTILDEIEERVLTKDDLDYQYTWQLLVKSWLLVHLPLSCAMIPLVLFHVLVNYAFSLGGV
jgi:hypothetical protein